MVELFLVLCHVHRIYCFLTSLCYIDLMTSLGPLARGPQSTTPIIIQLSLDLNTTCRDHVMLWAACCLGFSRFPGSIYHLANWNLPVVQGWLCTNSAAAVIHNAVHSTLYWLLVLTLLIDSDWQSAPDHRIANVVTTVQQCLPNSPAFVLCYCLHLQLTCMAGITIFVFQIYSSSLVTQG